MKSAAPCVEPASDRKSEPIDLPFLRDVYARSEAVEKRPMIYYLSMFQNDI